MLYGMLDGFGITMFSVKMLMKCEMDMCKLERNIRELYDVSDYGDLGINCEDWKLKFGWTLSDTCRLKPSHKI